MTVGMEVVFMSIDKSAVANHGSFIPFEQLIVFDKERREKAARLAFEFLTEASHDTYGYHAGANVQQWKNIIELVNDANPHFATSLKAIAIRRIEATAARPKYLR